MLHEKVILKTDSKRFFSMFLILSCNQYTLSKPWHNCLHTVSYTNPTVYGHTSNAPTMRVLQFHHFSTDCKTIALLGNTVKVHLYHSKTFTILQNVSPQMWWLHQFQTGFPFFHPMILPGTQFLSQGNNTHSLTHKLAPLALQRRKPHHHPQGNTAEYLSLSP